ncbi:SRPBCC family protein [Skermania sp. ID1734]|uniref:SRPBCC family protein n=1 Tax=Skermania sp. ID1734 TaxID=2597516 RepID=UPI00117F5F4B|nr:SRPBCC family protein [Skermania sp. ID1734]TSD99420.1 SRPBCC family protein [Skermania sp. ID1734]
MTNTLEASIDIDASPEKVWAVVSDLRRMPEWSPQCRKMFIPGQVREGARTLNINRDGWKFWPTTAQVVRFDPNKAVAFKVDTNRSIWSYELEPTATGTKLIERRETPNGLSWISTFTVEKTLGGEERFEKMLVQGMNESLAKIKQSVEAAV